MLQLALLFLMVALFAGALGALGTAAVSAEIAWALCVLFLALFVLSLLFGRPAATPPM